MFADSIVSYVKNAVNNFDQTLLLHFHFQIPSLTQPNTDVEFQGRRELTFCVDNFGNNTQTLNMIK